MIVDVNRASRQELLSLPGIGPARAADLVAYRELHGPFATLESLTAVPGIGPGIVARLEVDDLLVLRDGVERVVGQ